MAAQLSSADIYRNSCAAGVPLSAWRPCIKSGQRLTELPTFLFRALPQASKAFYDAERRHNYTTPKTFLELIKLYKSVLTNKRKQRQEAIDRCAFCPPGCHPDGKNSCLAVILTCTLTIPYTTGLRMDSTSCTAHRVKLMCLWKMHVLWRYK